MKRVIALAAVLTLLLATAAQGAPLRWTWQTPLPQGNDLWSVTYGAGQFVAVGDGGSILTSPDGKSWTLQPAPTMVSLRSVIYAGGRFVAVGGRPAEAVILTSADGQAWTLAYHGPGPAPVAVT
ncbi:MAG TPA: hypothetical protein VNT75_12950, partial [Symbiobacteriaceae bacterium]|nr:hypothetical protein [Symbiobacteriaceae bacterium]